MKNQQMLAFLFAALVASTGAEVDYGRKLLQTVAAGTPSTLTVSAANPNVNAITITPVIPYPQNKYFCNVTGDSRIPQQGPFPLTVRVPVGVRSTVIFANITGPIPGMSCTMASTPATSVVQQKGAPTTSIQQMINNPSSVVQQTSSGSSVVQQQVATSVNQQMTTNQFMNCVANTTSVVQQNSPPSSVVQQKTPPSTVVQQQTTPTTVVQQNSPPTTVVQQNSPPTTVVQQSSPATTVVQQTTPSTTAAATTVVQQSTPGTTAAATTVVQQKSPPSTVVQQSGRHLLQAGTIEYISNNGSTGQPQLTVLDTTEGVPNISFLPTAAGQTAQFNGGLQVAVTTTNNGFGTPYIPYQVDSKLSPQCNVQVNFVSF